jgi:hypothetical protein
MAPAPVELAIQYPPPIPTQIQAADIMPTPASSISDGLDRFP